MCLKPPWSAPKYSIRRRVAIVWSVCQGLHPVQLQLLRVKVCNPASCKLKPIAMSTCAIESIRRVNYLWSLAFNSPSTMRRSHKCNRHSWLLIRAPWLTMTCPSRYQIRRPKCPKSDNLRTSSRYNLVVRSPLTRESRSVQLINIRGIVLEKVSRLMERDMLISIKRRQKEASSVSRNTVRRHLSAFLRTKVMMRQRMRSGSARVMRWRCKTTRKTSWPKIVTRVESAGSALWMALHFQQLAIAGWASKMMTQLSKVAATRLQSKFQT